MSHSLDATALDQIFTKAKTHSHWLKQDVPDALLSEIYDLCKMAPTSANCQPIRIIFIKSAEAKEKLRPCLFEGNLEKTMAAPVTAVFAYDMEFYNKLTVTFPHVDAKPWFTQNENDTFIHALPFETARYKQLILCWRLVQRGSVVGQCLVLMHRWLISFFWLEQHIVQTSFVI